MWVSLAVGLAAVLGVGYAWAFRQVAAALPMCRNGDGSWEARNLTWYGLLAATAYAAGAALFVFLLGSLGVGAPASGLLGLSLLGLGLPASKLMNILVERKTEGFTVGGAVFVGGLAAPWLILGCRRWGVLAADPAAILAALALSYALGEGIGRLACISFGCCYGRPAAEMPAALRRLCFVFTGPTKKIAYQGGLEGVPVFAVQGVTAVLYTGAALAGLVLFGGGRFRAAGILALAVTGLWRAASEPLRRDHHVRPGQVLAYAGMALATVIVGVAFLLGFPAGSAGPAPEPAAGWRALTNPGVFPVLLALWSAVVWRMGLSEVTVSRLTLAMRVPVEPVLRAIGITHPQSRSQ